MAVSEPGPLRATATLQVRLRKNFASSQGFRLDVQFTALPGITILFGASGAGKTTVLNCIAGLQRPDEGVIAAGESRLFDSATGWDVAPQHRSVGYLFQRLALFPHMTVLQNVEYGLAALEGLERTARRQEILDSFHIAELAGRRPHEISGGERQRVALARTLVTRPRVLLLDEPLTALDALTKARLIDDLRQWNRQYRIPILYVTHDREEVFALGEQVIALQDGRILAAGTPHQVLQRPQRESVAQLAGFENIFDCEVLQRHPELGTMTCRIVGSGVSLEAPVTRGDDGRPFRLGIRAGDILIAASQPQGLSARNVLPGGMASLEQRDVLVIAKVDCGTMFEVHLTPGAVQSLALHAGARVWLVIKTYSCHVLQ
jgi:molybdate transport system ATP-binding protein